MGWYASNGVLSHPAMTMKKEQEDTSETLFPMPPQEAILKFKNFKHPIWTENKSKLIERYLYYFVLITRHGTYIDGFAGPQKPSIADSWTAKRVLESRPRWFRHFYLFDILQTQVRRLECLRDAQPARTPKEASRNILITPGNFNQTISSFLGNHPIKDKEAAFCLLDQRTFECNWETVRTLAMPKQGGRKIELFYFLPNAWLDRAVKALKKERDQRMCCWWGASDWQNLLDKRGIERGILLCERFKQELGYTYAYPFPIFSRANGGRTMYFMIHASDHEEAPKLMFRAYGRALEPLESRKELEVDLPGLGATDENAAQSDTPSHVKEQFGSKLAALSSLGGITKVSWNPGSVG